jgi:hypothetical protein
MHQWTISGDSNIFVKQKISVINGTKRDEILLKLKFYDPENLCSRLLCSFEVLCILSVLLLVLSKDDCKISVSFELIQNLKVSHFSIAKVKKSQYHSYLVTYYDRK